MSQLSLSAHNSIQKHPYIQFLCQFKELTSTPTCLGQLADGLIVLQFAQIIAGFVAFGQFSYKAKGFPQKLNNLKMIHRSIQKCWNSVFNLQIESQEIDFIEIAHLSNEKQIEKLLQLLIKTAMQAQNRDYFIQKMASTSSKTQQFLQNIITKVQQNQLRESPRKQKEKRMFDKIMQLDHQNDKLQQVLEHICWEKEELETKLKHMKEELDQKNEQIQGIQILFEDQRFTPFKGKYLNIPDTSARKEGIINALHLKITEMNTAHQLQLKHITIQNEKLTSKAESYDRIKDQYRWLKDINESYKQQIQQLKKIDQIFSIQKAAGIDKDNQITVLLQKMEKANKIVIEQQTTMTDLRAELEGKNLRIAEFEGKNILPEQFFSPQRVKLQSNTLYMDFPDLTSTQAEAYKRTNLALRQQLERTLKKIRECEQQLEHSKGELDILRQCQKQNRKLRTMVIELNTYRGQQNEILYATVHHLRNMLRQRQVC